MKRPRGRALAGIVAGVGALVTTAALAFARGGGTALPLAPLTTLGQVRPALPAGSQGPEDVPVPSGRSLAPPRPLLPGQRIDGIRCETGEQLAFHVHAHVRIVVRGQSREIPAGVGTARPWQVALTRRGRFVAGAACFAWLHTHAADGIVHIESPEQRTFTLGQFFDLWGQPLRRDRVGPATGRVTALFDGRVFTGDPRRIPLQAHAVIELEVGRPIVRPETVVFPPGL